MFGETFWKRGVEHLLAATAGGASVASVPSIGGDLDALAREEIIEARREGRFPQELEYRFRHARGHYVWLRDEMKLELNDDGKPTRILGCWLVIAADKSFVARVVNDSTEKTTTATAGRTYAKQTRTSVR